MQLAPLVCVQDVELGSLWYQRLLGCEGGHGGTKYERLSSKGHLVFQLHDWYEEHRHGRLGDPDLRRQRVILWFELEDHEAAAQRAAEMQVEVVRPSHLSENLNRELWLRDPDGYMIVLASPLPNQIGSDAQQSFFAKPASWLQDTVRALARPGLIQAPGSMGQKPTVVIVLLALAGQTAVASQTACTFEGGKAPHYYELEFLGYSDVNPVIVFGSTEFGSGKRITLPPGNYSLRKFDQEAAMVHLEFRNPGNVSLPTSFSLTGRRGHAQLEIGSTTVDGSLNCDY